MIASKTNETNQKPDHRDFATAVSHTKSREWQFSADKSLQLLTIQYAALAKLGLLQNTTFYPLAGGDLIANGFVDLITLDHMLEPRGDTLTYMQGVCEELLKKALDVHPGLFQCQKNEHTHLEMSLSDPSLVNKLKAHGNVRTILLKGIIEYCTEIEEEPSSTNPGTMSRVFASEILGYLIDLCDQVLPSGGKVLIANKDERDVIFPEALISATNSKFTDRTDYYLGNLAFLRESKPEQVCYEKPHVHRLYLEAGFDGLESTREGLVT